MIDFPIILLSCSQVVFVRIKLWDSQRSHTVQFLMILRPNLDYTYLLRTIFHSSMNSCFVINSFASQESYAHIFQHCRLPYQMMFLMLLHCEYCYFPPTLSLFSARCKPFWPLFQGPGRKKRHLSRLLLLPLLLLFLAFSQLNTKAPPRRGGDVSSREDTIEAFEKCCSTKCKYKREETFLFFYFLFFWPLSLVFLVYTWFHFCFLWTHRRCTQTILNAHNNGPGQEEDEDDDGIDGCACILGFIAYLIAAQVVHIHMTRQMNMQDN